MLKPVACQMPMIDRLVITVLDAPSQFGPSIPIRPRAALIGPMVGWKRYCHTVAMATSSEATGRK